MHELEDLDNPGKEVQLVSVGEGGGDNRIV